MKKEISCELWQRSNSNVNYPWWERFDQLSGAKLSRRTGMGAALLASITAFKNGALFFVPSSHRRNLSALMCLLSFSNTSLLEY
jgi:hypothetical protein